MLQLLSEVKKAQEMLLTLGLGKNKGLFFWKSDS